MPKDNKQIIEELLIQFWSVHHSTKLSKMGWTLKDSLDSILPRLIKEALSSQRAEWKKKIKKEMKKICDGNLDHCVCTEIQGHINNGIGTGLERASDILKKL